jgi:hypothetical protein
MNQNQQIAYLQQLAHTCASYFGQTDQGAIRVSMRHGAIYALQGLSTAVQNEQAVNANLNGQLDAANLFIAHLQARSAQKDRDIAYLTTECRRLAEENERLTEENRVLRNDSDADHLCMDDLATQATEVAAEIRKEAQDREIEVTKGFENTIATLEKAREELIVHHCEALVTTYNAYQDRLAEAIKVAAKAQEAKTNAHRLLVTIMDFALTQDCALEGYMSKKYHLVKFDLDVIRHVRDTLRDNEDAFFSNNDEVMLTLAKLEEIRAGMEEDERAANDPVLPTDESRVEELGDDEEGEVCLAADERRDVERAEP